MPKIAALGGLSSRGFGEFAQKVEGAYIEDVFSTYLYTGNSGTQTVNNGIDLSGKGGLVWVKGRNRGSNHALLDSLRGNNYLVSNLTDAQTNLSDFSTTFTQLSNGFRFVGDGGGLVNENTYTYASWTFRKQPKFFDVVTYTGNGVAGRTVNHNLGSVPGMIIVRRYDAIENWRVYHRSLGATKFLTLEQTTAAGTSTDAWNNTAPTSTNFTVGIDGSVNANGGTYVAYLFAHDTATDGIIQCGSFTTNGTAVPQVNLGWEPQYVMLKAASGTGAWYIYDQMRGFTADGADALLQANSSGTEQSFASDLKLNSTGFYSTSGFASNTTYIYMAIRRGPMKTPTDATKVFSPTIYTGNNSGQTFSPAFVPDSLLTLRRTASSGPFYNFNVFQSRLTGLTYLTSFTTDAEQGSPANTPDWGATTNTLTITTGQSAWNTSPGSTYVNYMIRRAPGFFDVVCYTGNGASTQTINHNLGVVPEMMIVKRRDVSGYQWGVYNSAYGPGQWILLNSTAKASVDNGIWGGVSPTATQFTVGNYADVNASGSPYVCYLFASCSGVSKVGTYTGTGTGPLTINCGFTAGARFVLIKTWDSTGGWYVYDTARGMSSGNDPYLLLNSTSAEVTTTDYVDTTPSGFIVNTPGNLNIGGFKYIYLAIA